MIVWLAVAVMLQRYRDFFAGRLFISPSSFQHARY